MDEAVTAGIPDEKIRQVTIVLIQKPIQELLRKEGFRPDLRRIILKTSIEFLVLLIR